MIQATKTEHVKHVIEGEDNFVRYLYWLNCC